MKKKIKPVNQAGQSSSNAKQITKDSIDIVFYGLQRFPKIFGNVIGILGLLWFGSTCFKLGWAARDNFFLRPIAEVVLGLESTPENKPSIFDSLEGWFND